MNEFMYEELQLQDHKIEPLIPWFQKCKVYIDNCLAQGGRILIHWYYFFSDEISNFQTFKFILQ